MSADAYRSSVAEAMGLPPERFERPGTTVVATEDRRGMRLVSHYRVDRHSVLWADPDVADGVAEWHGRPTAMTFDELRAWMDDRGAERVGAGFDHVLSDSYVAMPRPEQIRALDPRADDTRRLVTELHGACSFDDWDEAEFDPDDLDRILLGWIDGGRLAALAGARDFEPRPGLVDIGVIVHPDHRSMGRGRAVVAALVDDLLAAGERPMYRCNAENEGSWRLCRSLGFEVAVELEAFRIAG